MLLILQKKKKIKIVINGAGAAAMHVQNYLEVLVYQKIISKCWI